MLTDFKVSPLARKCLSYRPELIRVEFILNILQSKNEIYQLIELKEQ